MSVSHRYVIPALVLAASLPAAAQNRGTPYWASIRTGEVNMHAGPGEDYRVVWVYHRKQLPLKVLRLREGWRLVQDPDGARGWIVARLLSPERSAYVQGSGPADMRGSPDGAARVLWRLEPGVVGKLGGCANGWCQLDLSGRTGFVAQERLWGADKP